MLDVSTCPTRCHLAIPLEQTFLDPSFLIPSDLRKANISPIIGAQEFYRSTQKDVTCYNATSKENCISKILFTSQAPNRNSDRRESVRASSPFLLASRLLHILGNKAHFYITTPPFFSAQPSVFLIISRPSWQTQVQENRFDFSIFPKTSDT